MAPMSLMFLAFLLSSHISDAQTVIGSSSFFSLSPLDLNSSPSPTKQTVRFWPSLPPRGRSDVPIRITGRDRFTTINAVEQRITRPTTQLSSTFISVLSTQNLSSGPILTQPTASRPRTDTASLALSRAVTKEDATTKGSSPPLPTLPSAAVTEPAGDKPVTAGSPEEGSVKEDGDLQGLGSGNSPTVTFVKEESPVPLPTVADEMAQYWPEPQTVISEVKMPPLDSQTVKPRLFVLTTTSTTTTVSTTPQKRTTLSPAVIQQTPGTVALTGEN